MASLINRENSPFFWVQYRDPATGKRVRESLKIRRDAPDGRRRAKQRVAELERAELAAPANTQMERWAAWVPAYLEYRYRDSPLTLTRAKNAWDSIYRFLEEKNVYVPRLLSYAIAATYIAWRCPKNESERPKGMRKVKRNTAVLEMKFMSTICREAVRREFVEHNPCREVEAKREPAKSKKEITTEDIAIIEQALQNEPQWMREHWLVLMRQGCRCVEARTPMEWVREDDPVPTIKFRCKGGKLHVAPLHPDLLALVKLARSENRPHLVPVDKYAPKLWHNFFKKLNMPYSLHCTRVTVITKFYRAGAPVVQVCAYIGHSAEINEIYRRLQPADVGALAATLAGSPSLASSSALLGKRGMPDATIEHS